VRILVTGATGFLGSALACHWAAAGHEVSALLRPGSSTHRLAGSAADIAQITVSGDGDVANAVMASAPEVVVHTACAYGRAGETALQLFDANLRLGMVLLQALAGRVGPPVTWLNTATVLGPEVSLYALSKRQFSEWGTRLALQNPARVRFVDLRLQHMYGPGDDRSKFTTHVMHACHRNEPRLALTAGAQQRDFVHVDDVVSAYDIVLQSAQGGPTVDAVDIGSGVAPTVRQFVEAVHRLTRSSTVLDFGALPYRPGEAMHCVADTARLQSLGWRPRHDLTGGLQDVLNKEFKS
jgi:nucleoside-diphosphate-sugar epimerase